jgi:MFS family permease
MVVLAYAHSLAVIIAALVLAGGGLSTHFLLARTLIAEVIPGDSGRNRVYSMIALAVNISGAVGPVAATTLYAFSGANTLLFIVAGCYLAAAVLLVIMVPADLSPLASSLRWPVSRATLRSIRRDTASLRTLVISAAGGFLYSQFFSSIALLITTFVAKGPEQGSLFAINAITVIAVQIPMAMLIGRRLDQGMIPASAMRLGLVIFSVAMVALGVLLRTGMALFLTFSIMIVIFSVAETIYTPVRDTAFARMPAVSQIEAFNLRFIFITIGESAGALCGGAIFLSLAGHGTGPNYWLVLGVGGIAVAIMASLLRAGDPAGPDRRPIVVSAAGTD